MTTERHFDVHLRNNHDFNSLKAEIMLRIKIYWRLFVLDQK